MNSIALNLRHALLLLILSLFWKADGQTVISGVINTYTSVNAVNQVDNEITVDDTTGFSPGDTVLIIQMKGAVIDSSNTASFGDILNYGSAGLYEMNIIESVSGNDILFRNTMTNAYEPQHTVQLVSVPNYQDAILGAQLAASFWNGSTGGVVALVVHGTLDLNGFTLNASQRGFLGANYVNVTSSCNFFTSHPDYYYPSGDWRGAPKGESISDLITGREWGRGPQGNGGGGGNDHNSGGGGGSNLGAGGIGGENQEPGGFNCDGFYPGNGGKPLAGSDARLFFGGGGGAGQGNNNSNSDGGRAGGIIMIRAGVIEGNNGRLRNFGGPGSGSINDGAGGGGAGGTTIIEVGSYGSTTMYIETDGGDGGDANNVFNRCYGPGGGGSAGPIYYNTPSLPANVIVTQTPGDPGITFNSTNPCNLSSLGATSGTSGSETPDSEIVFSTTPFGSPVPVELISFDVYCNEGHTQFDWSTAVEINSDYFELMHSTDLSNWESIARIQAAGNSKNLIEYQYEAKVNQGFIRLKQVDLDGSFELFSVAEIPCQSVARKLSIYPNPGSGLYSIEFDLSLEADRAYTVFDLQGRTVLNGIFEKGVRSAAIDLTALPAGFYSIRIEGEEAGLARRLIKQ